MVGKADLDYMFLIELAHGLPKKLDSVKYGNSGTRISRGTYLLKRHYLGYYVITQIILISSEILDERNRLRIDCSYIKGKLRCTWYCGQKRLMERCFKVSQFLAPSVTLIFRENTLKFATEF